MTYLTVKQHKKEGKTLFRQASPFRNYKNMLEQGTEMRIDINILQNSILNEIYSTSVQSLSNSFWKSSN